MRILTAILAASVGLSNASLTAAPRGLPVGACLNIGNTLEVSKATELGDGAVTAADFERIRAAGFDTVRLPVRWDDRSQSAAPYTIDPEWLRQVQGTVDAALAAGLKVILNSHHFQPIYKDPLAVQPWHTAVWGQIAPRFKDYPTDRLWFELENEPHDKFDDSNLRAVLDPALAQVRKTNPTRPVIYGGQMWSGIDSLATLTLPDDPNVYPTFHYYEPFDFTHMGASWVAPNIPPPGRMYGSQADAQRLVADVAKIKAYTARTGLVPLMGESGAYDKYASLAQRVAYTKAVHDAFVPAGVPVCQWAYKNTFPFWDKGTRRWLPGLRGALGLKEDGAGSGVSGSPLLAQGAAPPANPADPLAELRKSLPGALINDPTDIVWPTQGSSLKVKPVQDAAIPGGGAARRYTVPAKLANLWEAQALAPLTAGISAGQTITVGFYARTVSAKTADGKGTVGLRIQQNAAPYYGFADTTLSIGPGWQWYEVTGVAGKAIARDVATIAFQLGGAAQEIEIGQTIVIEGAPSIQKTVATTTAAPEPELPPQLQGQGVLLNQPAQRNWANNGAGGSFADRDEPKIWLGKATRFTTTAVGANPWDLGTSIPIDQGIQVGDKLLIAVAARTESASTPDGKAKVGIRVQSNTPPYDGFAQNTFTVGPNWQLVRIKTTATQAFAPGAASVALHFAGAAQTVDIGPVYVIKTP
jgi:endoglucanase